MQDPTDDLIERLKTVEGMLVNGGLTGSASVARLAASELARLSNNLRVAHRELASLRDRAELHRLTCVPCSCRASYPPPPGGNTICERCRDMAAVQDRIRERQGEQRQTTDTGDFNVTS